MRVSVLNTTFGFEIVVAILTTFFAILMCTGHFQPALVHGEKLVELERILKQDNRLILNFAHVPTAISYSIKAEEPNCLVAELWPFSDCGLRVECHGFLTPNSYNKIKTRLEMVSSCNFTGYVRAIF